MRQIENYLNHPPKTMTVKHLAKHKVWDEIVINQVSVESKHYNRAGVKEQLLKVFAYRCGYCEKFIEKYAPIEHFRPKHKEGYYWLGATWSNLLVACHDCNGHKGSAFDIRGTPATMPAYAYPNPNWHNFFEATHISHHSLTGELPLLLHPVLDDPQLHLSFESDGTINPISPEGHYTITLCKLSDMQNREGLIVARQKIIETYRNRLVDLAKLSNDADVKRNLLHVLLDMTTAIKENEKYAHSAVHRACFERFKAFFIMSLPDGFERDRLNAIYKQLMSYA